MPLLSFATGVGTFVTHAPTGHVAQAKMTVILHA